MCGQKEYNGFVNNFITKSHDFLKTIHGLCERKVDHQIYSVTFIKWHIEVMLFEYSRLFYEHVILLHYRTGKFFIYSCIDNKAIEKS